MKPEIPRSSMPGIYLLGLLNAIKAAAMVVFADGLASSIVAAINGTPVLASLSLAAAAAVVRSVMVWAVQVSAKRTALGAKEQFRVELTQHWIARAGSEQANQRGGATVLASSGLDALDGYYHQYLPALVSAATVPAIIGVRILAADWVSALIVVLTVPLVPVFMALIGWFTQDKVSQATGALLRLSSQLTELARGLPVLIGLGRAREQRAALDRLGNDYRRTTMATLRVAFLSALALELIATLSVALVAVFIGVWLVYGQLDLGTGLLVLILVAECYLPLRELGTAFHASDDGREAMRRSKEELAAPIGDRLATTGGKGAELNVSELSVRYLDRAVPALSGVSFSVPRGKILAISGASGCGKSTLLGALIGTVTSAEADLAGSVRGIDAKHVAWLPQDPGSTERSVMQELLLWGAIDPQSAAEILASVGLAGRENQHPAWLSPGQLRRLALARVLVRVDCGADKVLVDEPTAHVDAASARLIEDALISLRGRATVLIVSHDARVLALADQQLELVAPTSNADPGLDSRAEVLPPAQEPLAPGDEDGRRNDSSGVDSSIIDQQSTVTSEQRFKTTLVPGIVQFLRILQPWLPAFLGSIFFGVIASLAALALTALSGWLIVRASQQPPVLYLLTAIVGVRFFGLLRAVARYVERLNTHQSMFAAADRLRGRLWDALSKSLPANRELSRGDSVLPRLIGDVDALRNLAPRVLLPPITAVLAAVAVIVSTSLLFPQALGFQVVILLGAVLLCPAVALWADSRSRNQEQAQRSKLISELTVLLGSAAELRSNGIEQPLLSRLFALDRKSTALAQRGAWAEGLGLALLTTLACAGSVGMIALGSPLVTSGQLRIEVLVALVLLQLGLLDVFSPLVQSAPGLPLLRRLWRSVARELQVPELPHVPVATSNNTIQARQLSIGWQGLSVADGIDLELAQGDWLTVTGPSGAGKSTFLATLMGFTAPVSGRVAVHGSIAWCPQEAHLFNSTLRGNLALARKKSDPPSELELHQVLHEVGLAQWLSHLPAGLETRLGDAGGLVSGGQRQRIAVARALLTRADVVLLDEPTAHLDAGSAAALMSDLRSSLRAKTVVLITHRPQDVQATDIQLKLGVKSASGADGVNDRVGV